MTAFKPYVTGEQESQLRQWLSYLFQQSSTGVAKTGVLAGLGVSATTPSASGSVVVGKGAAVCQPSSQAFPLVEPANETFDVFTANPMQFVNNPRNDIIVLDQVTGLVANLVGTPNAVPSSGEQSVPATAVPLARLRHNANATTIPASAIDDLRVTVRTAPAAVAVDVAWTNLPIPASGWTAPTEAGGGHRWQAMLANGRVSFRGVLANSAYTGGWNTICTLPTGIPAPADTLALSLAGNGNAVRSAQITPAGEVQVYAAGTSAAWFVLGGGYPVA